MPNIFGANLINDSEYNRTYWHLDFFWGFGGVAHEAGGDIGNKLTVDEQWNKLKLVKEIADEVWFYTFSKKESISIQYETSFSIPQPF